MSVFKTVSLTCPHCSKTLSFEASESINADRRPDLRGAILDGSMQRQDCPHCGQSVRLDPRLTYIDVKRGQWIAAFPVAEVDRWAEYEVQARQAFDQGFGPAAGSEAEEIGQSMSARIVFGWTALREKILARDAGLDDLLVEFTKMALLRGMAEPPLPPGQELRLVAVDEAADSLAFVTMADARAPADAAPGEQLSVPKGLYDDIAAEPDDWQALRDALSGGYFVDVLKLIRGSGD